MERKKRGEPGKLRQFAFASARQSCEVSSKLIMIFIMLRNTFQMHIANLIFS